MSCTRARGGTAQDTLSTCIHFFSFPSMVILLRQSTMTGIITVLMSVVKGEVLGARGDPLRT